MGGRSKLPAAALAEVLPVGVAGMPPPLLPKLSRLDEAAFTAEAERRATELEQARGPLLANASHSLHRLLDEAFAECQGPDRVKAFADCVLSRFGPCRPVHAAS